MGWFGGKSDQEKAYEDLMKKSGKISDKIGQENFDVKNLFADYDSPYGGEDQLSQLGDYFNQRRSNANSTFGREADKAGANAGKMVASQGLTGSVAMDAIGNARDNVLDKKYDYLSNLNTAESGGRLNVMNNANAEKFRTTGASQNVLSQNIQNLLSQYGLQTGAIDQQARFAQTLDPTTAWDDILKVGQIGATAAVAASDINVKENIEYLGKSQMGFPIISFNYIWNKAKRYVGSIAQDVEKLMPNAVIEENGIKMVDYSLIDVLHYEV